jgi:hypothetical protein
MKRFMNKKVAAIGLATGLVLGGAGAAFAFFTSTGTGTGSATTGSASQYTVSSTADTSGDLVPNHGTLTSTTAGLGVVDTIPFTVKNNSAGSETLDQIVISIGNSTGTAPNQTETNWTAGTAVVSPPEAVCGSNDFSVGGAGVGDGSTAGSGSFTIDHSVDPTLPDDLAAGATYTGSVSLQMVDNALNQDQCEAVTVPLFLSAS